MHLATPDPFAEQPQMVYENVLLAAQILHRVRTTISVPVLAKLGAFRTPRALHETATKLAPWAHGFVLVSSIQRRVIDEEGNAAFDGSGRDRAEVVGADMFTVSSRQVSEMLAWRKAGAWERAILAVGGITTVERADTLLRGGADAVLVATVAFFDPLFATRFRQSRPPRRNRLRRGVDGPLRFRPRIGLRGRSPRSNTPARMSSLSGSPVLSHEKPHRRAARGGARPCARLPAMRWVLVVGFEHAADFGLDVARRAGGHGARGAPVRLPPRQRLYKNRGTKAAYQRFILGRLERLCLAWRPDVVLVLKGGPITPS